MPHTTGCWPSTPSMPPKPPPMPNTVGSRLVKLEIDYAKNSRSTPELPPRRPAVLSIPTPNQQISASRGSLNRESPVATNQSYEQLLSELKQVQTRRKNSVCSSDDRTSNEMSFSGETPSSVSGSEEDVWKVRTTKRVLKKVRFNERPPSAEPPQPSSPPPMISPTSPTTSERKTPVILATFNYPFTKLEKYPPSDVQASSEFEEKDSPTETDPPESVMSSSIGSELDRIGAAVPDTTDPLDAFTELTNLLEASIREISSLDRERTIRPQRLSPSESPGTVVIENQKMQAKYLEYQPCERLPPLQKANSFDSYESRPKTPLRKMGSREPTPTRNPLERVENPLRVPDCGRIRTDQGSGWNRNGVVGTVKQMPVLELGLPPQNPDRRLKVQLLLPHESSKLVPSIGSLSSNSLSSPPLSPKSVSSCDSSVDLKVENIHKLWNFNFSGSDETQAERFAEKGMQEPVSQLQSMARQARIKNLELSTLNSDESSNMPSSHIYGNHRFPNMNSNSQRPPLRRTGSFNEQPMTETDFDSDGYWRKPLRRCGSFRTGGGRPNKPPSFEAVQEWYWSEELPRGSGCDPATGALAPWFHGAISRQTAEKRLESQAPGTFLVRLTDRLWGYAISVRSNQDGTGASHFLVEGLPDPVHIRRYRMVGAKESPFLTLNDLVHFYSKHNLTSCELLTAPCPRDVVKTTGSSWQPR